MSNADKAAMIRPWINEEERVTVDFVNESGLNAQVLGCTDQVVEVELETTLPHMTQRLTLPWRNIQVGEDRSHYTRDPEAPLQRNRLRLTVDQKRPEA